MAKLTDEQKNKIKAKMLAGQNEGFTDEEIKEFKTEQIAGELSSRLKGFTIGELFAANRCGNIAERVAAGDYKPNPDAEITERTPIPLLPLTEAKDKEENYYLIFSDDPEGELNPTSPNFNRKRYEAELAGLQEQIDELSELVLEYSLNLTAKLAESIPADIKEAAANFVAKIPQIVANFGNWMRETLTNVDFDLLDYVLKELEKPENKALLDKYGTMGELTKAPEWQEIIAAARQAKLADEKATLPNVLNKKLIQADYPLEYFSQSLFDEVKKLPEGQLSFMTTNDAGATMCVSFAELESIEGLSFTKQLDNYDKRVWVLVANLGNLALKNGLYNAAITPATLLKLMGKKGNTHPEDVAAIEQSILKLSKTQVIINNFDESRQRPHYSIFPDAMFYLLPVEIGDAVYNGKVVHKAILLPQSEPRLMQYARMKKQITTFNVGVFQAPLSLTDSNLRLTDYLIEQISHIRNKYRNSKMLFSSIFEAAGKEKTKDPGRVKTAIYKALDHYASEQAGHFIWGYEILKDGVQIYTTKEDRAAAEAKGKKVLP